MLPRITGACIRLFDREYDVGYGRWGQGANALFLVNRETGALLPATADGQGNPANPREARAIDIDHVLAALEGAGIVRKSEASEDWGLVKLAVCDIVHPEILEYLAQRGSEKPAALHGDRRDGLLDSVSAKSLTQDIDVTPSRGDETGRDQCDR